MTAVLITVAVVLAYMVYVIIGVIRAAIRISRVKRALSKASALVAKVNEFNTQKCVVERS